MTTLFEDEGAYVMQEFDEKDMDMLNRVITNLLDDSAIKDSLDAHEEQRKMFWVNLVQSNQLDENNGDDEQNRLKSVIKEYDGLVELGRRVLKNSKMEDPVFDGVCVMFSPPGSRAQLWHLDYNPNQSVCIINVTNSAPETATDYVVMDSYAKDYFQKYSAVDYDGPDKIDTDDIDIQAITEKSAGIMSIRKMHALPFHQVYMKCGTVHRGAGNPSAKWRIAVAVSMARTKSDIAYVEPSIHDDKS